MFTLMSKEMGIIFYNYNILITYYIYYNIYNK